MKEIDALVKKDILPDNRNEIFRRGLHATRYLAEVNEQLIIHLLSEYLHRSSKSGEIGDFENARSLSLVVLAVMISKYGLLRSENFETIPMTLQTIHCARTSSEARKNANFSVGVQKTLGEMATTIDTIYLKH